VYTYAASLCTRKKIVQKCKIRKNGCTTVQLHSVIFRYTTVALCKIHHALWRPSSVLCVHNWLIFLFLNFCYVLRFSVHSREFWDFFSRMLHCTNTGSRPMYNTVLGLLKKRVSGNFKKYHTYSWVRTVVYTAVLCCTVLSVCSLCSAYSAVYSVLQWVTKNKGRSIF